MAVLRGVRTAGQISPPPPGESVQPAGVDLRVDQVFQLGEEGVLGRGERRIPQAEPLEPQDGWWRLGPGGYKIRFVEAVLVPADAVGFCFPRSSLLRMGATVACGVWDPGYRGRGEALLVVTNPHGILLERGARVAQLVLVRMEEAPDRLYEGAYQGENLEG